MNSCLRFFESENLSRDGTRKVRVRSPVGADDEKTAPVAAFGRNVTRISADSDSRAQLPSLHGQRTRLALQHHPPHLNHFLRLAVDRDGVAFPEVVSGDADPDPVVPRGVVLVVETDFGVAGLSV